MKIIDTAFGKIIIDENTPKDMMFLIQHIKFTRYENLMTGEVKEVMDWNPKAAGIITNIKKE